MQPEHTLIFIFIVWITQWSQFSPCSSDAVMNPGTTTIDFYLFFLRWRLAAYLETLFCQSYMEIMFCFVAADDTCCVFSPPLQLWHLGQVSYFTLSTTQTCLPLQIWVYSLHDSCMKHLLALLKGIQATFFFFLRVATCLARLCPFQELKIDIAQHDFAPNACKSL